MSASNMDLDEIFRNMSKEEFSFYDYDGMVMSSTFPANILDKIKKTAFNDDDIIIATYPRCGTTLMQEMVHLVLNDGKASDVPIYTRDLFIEGHFPGLAPDFDKWTKGHKSAIIKSHLGSHFFRKTLKERKTKFIVVLRNPKDALVSYYQFYKMNMLFKFSGSWDNFFQLFKEKKISHGDIFEVMLSWWKLRDDPHILIVKYEDILKSPEEAIRKIAGHLGKSLQDKTMREIAEMTSFETMQVNPLLNYTGIPLMRTEISPFIRKGKVGDWTNYFSKEQSNYVNQLSDRHLKMARLFLEEK